jgi:REP element-mobilizing transposase RayT
MTRARSSLISLDDTPYYHCVSRCVRRAFLWGQDRHSGKDFSHRKQWVIDRLAFLTEVFAIEVCAYAVMANHYHVVVRVDRAQAEDWSDKEVIERWQQLFSLPILVARFHAGQRLSQPERDVVKELVARWRGRLQDLSWFMRCLNEDLARRANAEDGCTGRFWEGRFKSQALLDEAGLLTCMAYVDLNPIRAGIAQTPETSEFTSIYQRIRELARRGGASAKPANAGKVGGNGAAPMLSLKSFIRTNNDAGISLPFGFSDYLELVDWTGRAVREDKRGHVPSELPPILARLNIDPKHWLREMQIDGDRFGRAVGRLESLRSYAVSCGQNWLQGIRQSKRMFENAAAG